MFDQEVRVVLRLMMLVFVRRRQRVDGNEIVFRGCFVRILMLVSRRLASEYGDQSFALLCGRVKIAKLTCGRGEFGACRDFESDV